MVDPTLQKDGQSHNHRWVCLRPEDLSLVDNEPGIMVQVNKYIYHGGYGTIICHPINTPGYKLHVFAPLPGPPPGSTLIIRINSGWLLPQ